MTYSKCCSWRFRSIVNSLPFSLVLHKSEVGLCRSIFNNLSTSYSNCLENVSDWSDAPSKPMYCCTISDEHYEYREYCCHYSELLSQHRIFLILLLLLVLAASGTFALLFLLNMYMIVVSSSNAEIPNINKLAFLPKPNFFPNADEWNPTRKRKCENSKSKGSQKGKSSKWTSKNNASKRRISSEEVLRRSQKSEEKYAKNINSKCGQFKRGSPSSTTSVHSKQIVASKWTSSERRNTR